MVQVMVDDPFYNRFISQVLPACRRKKPDLDLRAYKCNAAQACKNLRDGRADLALFCSLTNHATDLTYMTLFSDDLYLAFPRQYSKGRMVRELPEALAAGLLPFLHPVGSTLRTIEEQCLATQYRYLEDVMEGDYQTAVRHIQEGNAFTCLPSRYITQHARILQKGELLCRYYGVIAFSPQATLSPPAQHLIEQIMISYDQ